MMNMRHSWIIRRPSTSFLILGLMILIAGCATPAAISVRNVIDATAAPEHVVPTPTAQNAMSGMPGMEDPTMPGTSPTVNVPHATANASATDFVLIWVLFGTPTPTPSGKQAPATIQATAVSVAATP